MDPKYHVDVTSQALDKYFDDAALRQIIVANVSQDSLFNLLRPQLHFDNDRIAESLAYVETKHAKIVALANEHDGGALQRIALGQLCHTVQDFYSHSNYVDLWLVTHGDLNTTSSEEIDGLDADLLNHPDLHTGHFLLWCDLIYRIPPIKHLGQYFLVARKSHEVMNLDSPDKGPKFYYGLVAARQRTHYEYCRAAQAILDVGGQAALYRFHHVS